MNEPQDLSWVDLKLLGSYERYDEFQVARIIVNLYKPYFRTQVALVEIWRDRTKALQFAQMHSRTKIPMFWQAHDDAGTAGSVLGVRGIHIHNDGSAIYDIGENFEFWTYAEFDHKRRGSH